MFSHESIPLTILLLIMLLSMVTAVLHPVHAFTTWLRKRSARSSSQAAKKVDSR